MTSFTLTLAQPACRLCAGLVLQEHPCTTGDVCPFPALPVSLEGTSEARQQVEAGTWHPPPPLDESSSQPDLHAGSSV